jgi:phenylacetic acid degradation operon negative regulatory protein
VAALIRLLADLGVDEPAVRSAISRLKRRGILQARRHDGAAGYELSESALAILREGDARIFRRERATLADGWLLAVFSVPESQRHRRHVLRTELTRLGFGMAAPGVWIVPARPDDGTAEMLTRLGLDGYAELFRARHVAFGDLAVKVREWWDFGELERLYGEFMRTHARVLDRDVDPGQDERSAFAGYMLALTDWRRLPYLDPGLPAELLPGDWIGIRAADLFFTLRSRLAGPAEAYVHRVTAAVGLPAGDLFRQGGLFRYRPNRAGRPPPGSRPARSRPTAGLSRWRPSPGSRSRPGAATPHRSRGRVCGSRQR